MTKISQLPSPAIAGVVKGKNILSAVAEIKNCTYDGATMIDLHMSSLESSDVESLKKIVNSSKLPILALNYSSVTKGEDAEAFEDARISSFLRAAEAGVAGIDIQGYTFHQPSKHAFCGEDKYSFTKGNPKEIVTDEVIISKQCELIERVHSMGAEVLLSCHPGIPMKCDQILDLAHFLEQRDPDIIKIVTKAETQEDLEESIRTMMALKKEIKTPVAYHANGKAGMLSRIINPILGGHIAFCVDRYNERSTMEQISLRATKEIIENINKIV